MLDNQETKKTPKHTDKIETESCVETRVVNRDTIMSKYESCSSSMTRPTSSPSKYDTKTKTKFRTQEYRTKSPKEDAEKQPKSAVQQANVYTQKQLQNQTQIFVTKVFESQDLSLHTSAHMYPMNVKSKLPNPTIVRPQTGVDSRNDSARKGTFRSKTAQAPGPAINPVPFLLGPKQQNLASNLQRSRSMRKMNDSGEQSPHVETKSRLASHDNLNLMTYKDVDRIVETINSYYISPQKSQDLQQADLYKKIWMLKSTGQYHGSLLMKQSARAPEIRE